MKKKTTDEKKLDIDKEYYQYRQGATGLSVTLIGLSASLLYWQYTNLFQSVGYKVGSPWYYLVLQILFLAGVIIFSIMIQLSIYFGYQNQARAYFDQRNGSKNEAENKWAKAQGWFGWADNFVCFSIVLSAVEFLLLAFQFLLQLYRWGGAC